MEAVPEHPFFVYGHGWASCDPDGSMHMFGLKCQRLQVGDVCISLTPRDKSTTSNSQQMSAVSAITQPSYFNPYYNKEELVQIPQNLSRKPQTIPTTATGTAVTSRPAPHFDVHHHQPIPSYSTYVGNCSNQILVPPQPRYSSSTITTASNNHREHHQPHNLHNTNSMLSDDGRPHSNHSSATISMRSISQDGGNGSGNHQQPLLINRSHANSHASNTATIYSSIAGNDNTIESNAITATATTTDMDVCPVDATLSRKRRWSAPDICDDENCLQVGQKNCNHLN